VLIRKLSSAETLGLVSTHDLELCALAESNERIENYHFREYYDESGINFDYKLQPGASTTRNAAYLMKLAGIDIDEQ
jgi:DNA mismatch repair ATPase MutS